MGFLHLDVLCVGTLLFGEKNTGRPIAEWGTARPLAALKPLFHRLPEGSLVTGAQTSGVTPAGLGAGYVTFFLYSTVIGIFAILLAFYVAKRQPAAEAEAKAEAEEGAAAQPS